MCVVADEIEEDGSNDASGADGAKRQRVGDASGGASGFEDGGGVRNGDELSADDLTQLAACDDVGLDLTEKESALLVAKRRACATRERQHGLSAMQGAQLHGFRLVRRDGQVAVECLLCNKHFDAQSGRYFLKNYLNWHVGKDRKHAQLAAAAREVLCSVSSAGAAKPFEAAAKPCEAPEPHEAAEPPVNATPHVSVSLCVASTRTTRSGATFGAAVAPTAHGLDQADLRELALADDERLSDDQRAAITALRLWTQTLEGGAAAHRFRVVLVEEAWLVDCEACGSRTLAFTKGEINFLNNFQYWHLARPGHKLAAALRQEAICQALHDAAVSSAADAQAAARQTAAAASAQPSATQLELERGAAAAAHAVEEAHAALLRAQEAATQAAALAKGELERHAPRGELEDRPLAATDLERLVGRTPALEWDEDEHGVRCGVRCTWCRVRVSADAVQTHNVNEHLAGARHRASAAYGGRTIDVFFGGRTRGPAPPPRAAPDQSDLCMGYWKPTLTLSGGVAELRPLLEEEPTKDAVWRPDRWFRNELVVSQGTGAEPASTVIEGTLRAAGCKRYCVGGDGRRATDGMCDACRRLPSDHNFKQMLNARLKAAARPDRDESRINFQLLPRVRLIEMLREKGVLITSLRRNIWLLRQSYLKKAARVRTLLERLDEQRLRGDTKALIEDIIAIERAGKFKQRQTLFHFLRDLVHSLR